MKVERILHYKTLFHQHLLDSDDHSFEHYFEAQANWQKYWHILGEDLATTYDEALQSKISAHLWGGQKNSPKSVMIEMIRHNEIFMRSAFKDLFEDEKDLGLRLDRFAFHCDEVFYSMMYNSNRLSTHHHGDRRYSTLYLTFQFPDKYGLWDYSTMQQTLEKLESRNIPQEVEIERYFKSQRALYNILSKDEEFIQLATNKLSNHRANSKTLLIINGFQSFIANHKS